MDCICSSNTISIFPVDTFFSFITNTNTISDANINTITTITTFTIGKISELNTPISTRYTKNRKIEMSIYSAFDNDSR